jgi:hypothetical protein
VAESEWQAVSDELSSSTAPRGPVTSAVVTPPNGGGSFTFGIHTQDNDTGVVAFYSTLANFAPTAKGGVVSGCIQKGVGAGGDDFSCFLFLCLGGTTSTSLAYLLGLDTSSTPRLVLRKGQVANGIPSVAAGSQGVLRRSAATYAIGEWLHVRLDAIKQPTGDVLLQMFASDLGANAVTSPVWEAVDGLSDFTDDALGINCSNLGISGSDALPLTSGRVGFGARFADVNRNAYFDHVKPERQTLP